MFVCDCGELNFTECRCIINFNTGAKVKDREMDLRVAT